MVKNNRFVSAYEDDEHSVQYDQLQKVDGKLNPVKICIAGVSEQDDYKRKSKGLCQKVCLVGVSENVLQLFGSFGKGIKNKINICGFSREKEIRFPKSVGVTHLLMERITRISKKQNPPKKIEYNHKEDYVWFSFE